jgi:predicted DNA-binding protein with PD1-like motif
MEYFEHNKIGRTFALRLDKGEDILEKLNDFIKKEKISDAVVVSGIGTVDQCTLHFVTHIDDASKMYYKTWTDKALELASVQGIIADGMPHIHAVVSDQNNAWGGHLEPGCRTLYLCELLIVEMPGFNITRVPKVNDENDNDHFIKKLVKKA